MGISDVWWGVFFYARIVFENTILIASFFLTTPFIYSDLFSKNKLIVAIPVTNIRLKTLGKKRRKHNRLGRIVTKEYVIPKFPPPPK